MEIVRAVDLHFDTSSPISLFKYQVSKSKPSPCFLTLTEKN